MTTARDDLYTRLREVLGDPGAHTLMELLPPTRDVVTKSDVDVLRSDLTEIQSDISEMRTDISGLNDRVERQPLSEFERPVQKGQQLGTGDPLVGAEVVVGRGIATHTDPRRHPVDRILERRAIIVEEVIGVTGCQIKPCGEQARYFGAGHIFLGAEVT